MSADSATLTRLAIRGGPKVVEQDDASLFHWPIVTDEDEQAVLDVLRAGSMSGTGITQQFEAEWGRYQGTKYNLAHCNGTAALLAAMYGAGIGRGDEIIVPTVTYWGSAIQAYILGATPVFADIHPQTLTIDPADIERHVSPRTKAVMVVHYCGHPADMDAIAPVAERHDLKIIEDGSHAQGTRYKGRLVNALGDVSGLSMMAGKSFAIGEAGMLCTDDREVYERAIALCHYERGGEVTLPPLAGVMNDPAFGSAVPLLGIKGRVNQTCSAMGRVQLKHYEQRIAEIQSAMNRFWDLLEGVPGLRPHRPEWPDSTMGGWYNPVGHYVPEELDGLPLDRYIEAVAAEGAAASRGVNFPLHLHPVLNSADVFGDGKPTRISFSSRDVRQPQGTLPVAEALAGRVVGIPWFKHDQPDQIRRHAQAFRKVAEHADQLA